MLDGLDDAQIALGSRDPTLWTPMRVLTNHTPHTFPAKIVSLPDARGSTNAIHKFLFYPLEMYMKTYKLKLCFCNSATLGILCCFRLKS